ncbi:MAG: phosphate ABC transporter substrate-binding/OmpA family protein [Filomicrobium sp.]
MVRYHRFVRAAALVLSLLAVGVGTAVADEIRLELKGGGFELTGELEAYDGKKFVINSPVFGKMTIDGTRFNCISDNCPTGPVSAAPDRRRAIVGGPVTGDIVIAGSNTIGNALMPALVEKFAKRVGLEVKRVEGADPLDLSLHLVNSRGDKIASVQLLRYGSTTSFRELSEGRTEIGMSSRRIKPIEVARLSSVGLGDMLDPNHEHVLGLDGIVMIVSKGNPAVSITVEDAAKIFSGQIKDWSQLGLPGGPINLYAPPDESGTFETFSKLILKPFNLKLSPDVKRTGNHVEQSDWVANDPQGIGFLGIAYLRDSKALNIRSACGLIFRPTEFSMKTEEYPLTRRLYLYSPGQPKVPLARQILSFALSDEAQEVIRETSFIDQSLSSIAFNEQKTRIAYALNAEEEDFDINAMREFIKDVAQAKRLTSTLRFETASFRLDSKSLSDVKRLARLFNSEAYKDKEVMLIGFADSVGSYEPNLQLSRQRANAVAAALANAGYRGATVKAYSELAPVACNDTLEDRQFNRRVEVWIK